MDPLHTQVIILHFFSIDNRDVKSTGRGQERMGASKQGNPRRERPIERLLHATKAQVGQAALHRACGYEGIIGLHHKLLGLTNKVDVCPSNTFLS